MIKTHTARIVLGMALLMPASATGAAEPGAKPRARDLGVPFDGTPGPVNAITDVQGVEVGYTTLVSGEGKRETGKGPVRTGVTAILPRGRESLAPVFAAFTIGNGNGDMTGTHWIEENGVLETPILITNTLSVGVVRDAAVSWLVKRDAPATFWYPVVAETSDGWLNDQKGQHVKAEHALAALEAARGGAIAEGNVGGGTGMLCNGFKGGTGTASRRLAAEAGGYTVGALVQCNYGLRSDLRIAGIPVGREIKGYQPCVAQKIEPPVRRGNGDAFPVCGPDGAAVSTLAEGEGTEVEQGSIIVVIATDAPLSPDQLKRVVRRVSLGLGRLGSTHGNGSGDIFIAFSTANSGADAGNSETGKGPATITRLRAAGMDPLFLATVEATEEAVVNAMVAAETMTGSDYIRVHAIPHEPLRAVLRAHGRLTEAK